MIIKNDGYIQQERKGEGRGYPPPSKEKKLLDLHHLHNLTLDSANVNCIFVEVEGTKLPMLDLILALFTQICTFLELSCQHMPFDFQMFYATFRNVFLKKRFLEQLNISCRCIAVHIRVWKKTNDETWHETHCFLIIL